MATKLSLLKSFQTGQGGGIATYVTYPADHDSNYLSIESSVNQLVDEMAASRLADAVIPLDILISDSIETATFPGIRGRFSPWEARVTRNDPTNTVLTVTSGRIFAGGQRIEVQGTTFSSTRASGLWYVASDATGLLTLTTTANSSVVDLASVTVVANLFTTPNTDLLAANTNVVPLISGNTANVIAHRTDMVGAVVGNLAPAIRLAGSTGTLQDAGFSHLGTASRFGWISQRDGGEGSGNAVVAAHFREFGQLSLLEQSRIQAIRTTTLAVATGAGFVSVVWDTPVANADNQRTWRREPEEYFANPWISAAAAPLRVPADADCDGTYLWTAHITLATAGVTTGFVEARIRATNGTATDIALVRVAAASTGDTTLCLSGMLDLAASDTIELQVRHGDAGSINVTGARITGMLIGGPVTP